MPDHRQTQEQDKQSLMTGRLVENKLNGQSSIIKLVEDNFCCFYTDMGLDCNS